MKKGYTLVEIMIVTFILAFLIGGIFMVLSSGKPTWGLSESRAALQLELRKTMMRISDDLRQTSINETYTDAGLTTQFPSGGTYSAIYFKVPQSISNVTGAVIWEPNPVSYTRSNNTIIRDDGTSQIEIASNITAMDFIRLANDVIEIVLSGRKVITVEHGYSATVEANLTSAVAARN